MCIWHLQYIIMYYFQCLIYYIILWTHKARAMPAAATTPNTVYYIFIVVIFINITIIWKKQPLAYVSFEM